MTTLLTELLINQTKEANAWTNKLIDFMNSAEWFATPSVVESNIAWQIGHLTLSQYYYTIVLLKGPDKDSAERVKLKKYAEFFANGSRIIEIAGEFSVDELKENWSLICSTTLNTLSQLNDYSLVEEIVKMPKQHPFVKTKQDSILWNIKHNMWHCGQIGTLKRIVDKPFQFGL